MTTFSVPGECVPWRMGKTSRYGGVSGLATLKAYEAKVADFARLAGCKCTDRAVRLTFEFVLPRPKRPTAWYPKRKDCTNLQKSTEDGLAKVAFLNDSQVVDVHTTKRYPVGDEDCGVHVQVSTLKEPTRRKKRTEVG